MTGSIQSDEQEPTGAGRINTVDVTKRRPRTGDKQASGFTLKVANSGALKADLGAVLHRHRRTLGDTDIAATSANQCAAIDG